jgi:uncharacterized protein (TIGR02996 family)
MWRATTEDEANFIFDLLAEPDASTTALVYADWLEERGDPARAEFLRLDLCPEGNEQRLQALRQQLDPRWLATVAGRRFRVGDVVRIVRGTFEGIEGTVGEVDARQGRAGLWLHMFCRQTELVWVAFAGLRLLKRAGRAEDQG